MEVESTQAPPPSHKIQLLRTSASCPPSNAPLNLRSVGYQPTSTSPSTANANANANTNDVVIANAPATNKDSPTRLGANSPKQARGAASTRTSRSRTVTGAMALPPSNCRQSVATARHGDGIRLTAWTALDGERTSKDQQQQQQQARHPHVNANANAQPETTNVATPMRRRVTIASGSASEMQSSEASVVSQEPLPQAHRRRGAQGPHTPVLSDTQRRGCFQYIRRRQSVALAFASLHEPPHATTNANDNPNPTTTTTTNSNANANVAHTSPTTTNASPSNAIAVAMTSASPTPALTSALDGSHWAWAKTKQGVDVFRSTRSRCEVRGVTRVNASVRHVMELLAADDSDGFARAQGVLLGRDQVVEARVLASCVSPAPARSFHCGLKYMALKNPFGAHPLDLVFLDYTDVTTTTTPAATDEASHSHGHSSSGTLGTSSTRPRLMGIRVLESIRVAECPSVSHYTRASLRCEVYLVRETHLPGVVEVTFASHLDPKSKYSATKKHTWLDQAVARLSHLRAYAEQAALSHHAVLADEQLVRAASRQRCSVCDAAFAFLLRKRYNCRLCGDVSCGKCCRKRAIFVGTQTTHVRVCVGCVLATRYEEDVVGRQVVAQSRRHSLANKTWIAYDEVEEVLAEGEGEEEMEEMEEMEEEEEMERQL